MRLTKFFPKERMIDRVINRWVKENPKQRVILQTTATTEGILVLYEKATRKEEWESIKRAFEKKPKKKKSVTS